MNYPTTCQRLRMGGTITGSALTGGTLIETHGRNLLTWDGLMGWTGKRGSNVPLLGRDGSHHVTRKPYRERLMTLALVGYDRDDDGLISLGSRMEELESNIDRILELLSGDDEQSILERDIAYETSIRWIRFEALDPAVFVRGPVFGVPHSSYGITQPVVASYPFWQSEAEVVTVIDGPGVIPNLGNARISNPILEYAGDGSLTNDVTGEVGVVAGSTGPVTVDVGLGSVLEGGLRAQRRFDPNTRHWMRFGRGDTAVTSTVEVTVRTRNSYHS